MVIVNLTTLTLSRTSDECNSVCVSGHHGWSHTTGSLSFSHYCLQIALMELAFPNDKAPGAGIPFVNALTSCFIFLRIPFLVCDLQIAMKLQVNCLGDIHYFLCNCSPVLPYLPYFQFLFRDTSSHRLDIALTDFREASKVEPANKLIES